MGKVTDQVFKSLWGGGYMDTTLLTCSISCWDNTFRNIYSDSGYDIELV